MPRRAQEHDDDASSSGSADCEWLLGFVEPAEQEADLLRHRFPSKVGGRPAWLNPRDLPTREQLTCPSSGKLMHFLLQVYAPPPADEEQPPNQDAFHRTIFLFVSPEGDALTKAGAVRALRCQLPRSNPFYPYDPPSESTTSPPPLQTALEPGRDPWRVQEAEAALAEASTSGRRQANGSCGSSRAGIGEGGPAAPPQPLVPAPPGMTLFPEMELVVEPEEDEGDNKEDPKMKRLLERYEEQVAEEGELSDDELPPEVVDQVEGNHSKERRHYAAFQARIATAPEQCLRYCFHESAAPLCPSPDGVPSADDVPPCPRCGGPRIFEFQVMPQLLNYLDLDEDDPQALDWGTIAVFSCKASCTLASPAATDGAVVAGEGAASSAYADEWVWVQGT